MNIFLGEVYFNIKTMLVITKQSFKMRLWAFKVIKLEREDE